MSDAIRDARDADIPPPAPRSHTQILDERLGALEHRVLTLEKDAAQFEAACAATVERIERLEPAITPSTRTVVAERRAAVARRGPFRASPVDTEVIVTADGRRFCAMFTSGERELVLQALNDLWHAVEYPA